MIHYFYSDISINRMNFLNSTAADDLKQHLSDHIKRINLDSKGKLLIESYKRDNKLEFCLNYYQSTKLGKKIQKEIERVSIDIFIDLVTSF